MHKQIANVASSETAQTQVVLEKNERISALEAMIDTGLNHSLTGTHNFHISLPRSKTLRYLTQSSIDDSAARRIREIAAQHTTEERLSYRGRQQLQHLGTNQGLPQGSGVHHHACTCALVLVDGSQSLASDARSVLGL